MRLQRLCKWPLALAARSCLFHLGHAWSTQGGMSTSPCSIIHEIFHTSSNARSASDNKLHPGISTAQKFPATIFGTKWKILWEWDSEAIWNRLISRTLSIRDARCKLQRPLYTLWKTKWAHPHPSGLSKWRDWVEPESGHWLSLDSYSVACSGLPLSLQKCLRHLGSRLSHSLTMWPWEGTFFCQHFPVYEIEMVIVFVSRATIIVVRLKYENSC